MENFTFSTVSQFSYCKLVSFMFSSTINASPAVTEITTFIKFYENPPKKCSQQDRAD